MNVVNLFILKIMIIPLVVIKLCMVLLLFLLVWLLYQSQHKIISKWKFILIILIISLCGSVWYVQNEQYNRKAAVIVKDGAFVYAGPEQSFHKIAQLKSGSSVQLLISQKNMCQILTDDQQRGWVACDELEVVKTI